MMKKNLLNLAVILTTMSVSSFSYGAAFQSNEQSAARMGAANAGSGVMQDPSIAYFNPAGMMLFKNPALAFSGFVVVPEIKYNVLRSTNFLGRSVVGTTNQPGINAFPAAFYYVQPIHDRFAFGLSLSAPFGLSTTYDTNSLARYFATNSKAEVINIEPAFAAQLTSKMSVGLGIDIQRFCAKIGQGLDFASIYTARTRLVNPAISDVFIHNDASGWSAGYDLGFLYQFNPETRLGLTYRSTVHHSLEGRMNVTNVPTDPISTAIARGLGLVDSHVETGVTLPDRVTLSLAHKFKPAWTVMADVQYILWSRLQNIVLHFNAIPTPSNPRPRNFADARLNFNYKDSWRVSIGQEYEVNPNILLRAGFAFDQSPVQANLSQTVRLPDSNRYWLTLGAGFHWGTNWSLDLAYAHIFFSDNPLKQTLTPLAPNLPPPTFIANYFSSNANVVGMQLNYVFA